MLYEVITRIGYAFANLGVYLTARFFVVVLGFSGRNNFV